MKTTLIILTLICNACYGQGNEKLSQWEIDYKHRLQSLIDSLILSQYGNKIEPERKRDTLLVERLYYSNEKRSYITTDRYTLIQPCQDCMVGYKKDTTYFYDNSVYWGKFYSVRELHNTREDLPFPYICGNCKYVDYWNHIQYLDANKKGLEKNIVVWDSK
jgi:hypothetical protein